MFLAFSYLEDNKQLLVMGLSKRNIELLQKGKPIDLSRTTHGMAISENLKIMIFAGETEESMREQTKPLIGPKTIIDQMKPI